MRKYRVALTGICPFAPKTNVPLRRFSVALLLKHANVFEAVWTQFTVVSVALALLFVIAGTAVPALITQLLNVIAPVPELMTAALLALPFEPAIVPLLTVNDAWPLRKTA